MKLLGRSSSSKKANSTLAGFTINKLKIHSVGLVGREEEILLLRSRLHHMMTQSKRHQEASSTSDYETDHPDSKISRLERSNIQKELVFIQGYSGVGKTSLSRALDKDIRETKTGMLVESKFDLNSSKAQPFAGIAQAYSSVFQRLKTTDVDACREIGRDLTDQLEEGAELLTYLIPELEEFVTESSTWDVDYMRSTNHDALQDKWKYGIRILTRILTSKVQPLVVCVDDLQWSDEGSLNLIESLISDIQNTSPLVIIGCYRSNEVGENSPLMNMMHNIQEKAPKFGFEKTDIMLKGLHVENVNEMIMRMIDTDQKEVTRDLADLCFQRTLGNPFFLIEFMNMLLREDLLKFSIGTMRWHFDIAQIEKATMSTANVVDLLKSRIKRMPKDFQSMLQYAACLGPTFNAVMLSTIWEHSDKNESFGDLSTILQSVEAEMLIEKLDDGRYRWVHDNVQEASLSLVANSDINSFRFLAGLLLYRHLSEKEVDEHLFDIADLISKGGSASVDLAELCLRAAKKAKKLAGFHSAARYVSDAVRMLPDDKWTEHRPLTLELYVLGATVEYLLGNSNDSVAYCKPILDDADFTLEDKLQLRLLECKRLSAVEFKHNEAAQCCLDLLKDMGYNLLWSRSLVAVQALTAVSKTVKAVKAKEKDFYVKLGRNKGRYRTISSILSQLQYATYFDERFCSLC